MNLNIKALETPGQVEESENVYFKLAQELNQIDEKSAQTPASSLTVTRD